MRQAGEEQLVQPGQGPDAEPRSTGADGASGAAAAGVASSPRLNRLPQTGPHSGAPGVGSAQADIPRPPGGNPRTGGRSWSNQGGLASDQPQAVLAATRGDRKPYWPQAVLAASSGGQACPSDLPDENPRPWARALRQPTHGNKRDRSSPDPSPGRIPQPSPQSKPASQKPGHPWGLAPNADPDWIALASS